MMATLGSIVLAALLFAVFGTLRFRSGCAGDCLGDCGQCETAGQMAGGTRSVGAGESPARAGTRGGTIAGSIGEVHDDHD